MPAVDTNVLVRLITRDDDRRVAAAEAFVAKGAWVSLLALAEAVWVLTAVYAVEAPAIATAVEMLLDHKDLSVQEPEVVSAALATFREQPNIGFTDCLVLEIARRLGQLPLGTFDRNLGKIEGAKRLS
jgi:predicted nucleic-acid-binding protein